MEPSCLPHLDIALHADRSRITLLFQCGNFLLIALAFGNDAIIPAKQVADAEKKYKNMVYILGGVLDGKFLSKQEMVALSKIPGREVLLSQLLNVMNSPIQGFAGTLNGVLRNFVCVLDQVSKAKA